MRFLVHIALHTMRWFALFTLCGVVPILALWCLARIVDGGFSWGEFVAKVMDLDGLAALLLLFSLLVGTYFGAIAAWTERRQDCDR